LPPAAEASPTSCGETAETFGWNWKVVSVAGLQLLHCCIPFTNASLINQSLLLLEERRRKIEEGQINAEKIQKNSLKPRSVTRKLSRRGTRTRKK